MSTVCFYRDVAPLVSLRMPRCYFAAMDADSGHSLLLLEDLAAGRAGDTLARVYPPYVRVVVGAGVHDFSLESLCRHIKLGFLFALLIAIFRSGSADTGERRRQDFTAWIERNIAMLEDHDVWEAQD